jgi:tRNA G10  N-methylase Trm11
MAKNPYFFVFGRTPRLSFLELRSLFPEALLVTEDVARVNLEPTLEVTSLLHVLGGTIKIAKDAGMTESLDASVSRYFDTQTTQLNYGVSAYGGITLPKTLLADIKKSLDGRGISARYVPTRDGEPLSSVSVDKKHIQELLIIKGDGALFVGKTVAVQPYETWSMRDYNRPHADAKSGMLPLKVARMVVNISLSTPMNSPDLRQKTIFDPFCGMGTVLGEAYALGCRVIGCDISEKSILWAKDNLEWQKKTYPSSKGSVAKLFVGDAVHVSEVLAPESVHAIVTEPFMGSTDIANTPSVDAAKVKNIIKGLEKLYIGCLRDWYKLLVPKGRIVIALPSYAISERTYFVKKVVDMCENLGYTIVDGPIEYSRPQAVVRRQFYILEKK